MARGSAQPASALAHAEEGADRLHRTLEQLLLLARVEGSLSFDDGLQSSAEQVARLARLELGEDEKTQMTAQLDAILGYMETLNALDTSGVEPTTTVIPMVSVMRDDVVRPSLDREEALANAPDREGAYFRVPRIIED